MKYWDEFPINVAEAAEHVLRESFTYNYTRFEAWQMGCCIFSGNSNGKVKAPVAISMLEVTIDDDVKKLT